MMEIMNGGVAASRKQTTRQNRLPSTSGGTRRDWRLQHWHNKSDAYESFSTL